MKVNTLIIGAQKCGTTALYDWLTQHPDIYGSAHLKDYPFFSDDKLYSQGENFYHNQFKPKNERIILGGSVHSLFYDYVPLRIKKFNPNIKIIIILRNPVERAWSAYKYAVERSIEERSFNQAIQDEIRLGESAYESLFQKNQKLYIEKGFYAKQLKRYFNLFPKESIQVLFYDEIKSDKANVIKKLNKFLDIKEYTKIDFTYKNVTKGTAKFKIINKIIYSNFIKNNILSKWVKNNFDRKYRFIIRKYLIDWNRTVSSSESQTIQEEDIRTLNNIYFKEIKELEVLLNINLKNWY